MSGGKRDGASVGDRPVATSPLLAGIDRHARKPRSSSSTLSTARAGISSPAPTGGGGAQRPELFDVGATSMLAGFVPGALLIVALAVGIVRLGLRLPLGRVFAGTNAVLLYLAFLLTGKGVYNLQEAGLFAPHPVGWVPDAQAFGSCWASIRSPRRSSRRRSSRAWSPAPGSITGGGSPDAWQERRIRPRHGPPRHPRRPGRGPPPSRRIRS